MTRPARPRRLRRLCATALVFAVSGCAGPARPGPEPELRIVSTVAPVTDLVRRVAAGVAEVSGLVPEGVDSHTFEPSPRHAAALTGAALFVAVGLGLEEPAIRMAEANLPEGAGVVRLGEQVMDRDDWVFDRSFPAERGVPNPHIWLDVVLAMRCVEVIAEQVAAVAPEAAGPRVRRNAEALTAQLRQLHAAILQTTRTVPPEARKLVTYHDSWAYFGPRYGFEVVAAVQPPGFGEPSAEDVRRLVDQLRDEGVPAVFGSEVFPSEVLERVAEETGVRFVGELADDALPGRPGEPGHSYAGMMVRNVRIVVEALGGDPAALDRVDPEGVA